MNRLIAVAAVAVSATALPVFPSAAATPTRIGFGAEAFRTSSGPTVRFLQAFGSGDPEANAPTVGRLRVTRPTSVSVRTPPSGRRLGTLEFFTGANTTPTSPDRRVLRLRRARSLGNGSYELAQGFGARIVLSTRYRSAFIRVNLPDGSRNVSVSLTGSGARLLRFTGGRSAYFTGKFLRVNGHEDSDSNPITVAEQQSAGLR